MSRQVGVEGRTVRSAVLLLLLVALTVLVAGPSFSPADAAGDAPGHALHHGSTALPIGLALVSLGGLGLMGGSRSGRKAVLISVALLVALFGLESAVHSVHHLSDPQAATSCAVLSASQHAPAVSAATPDVGAPTWTAEPSPTVDERTIPSLQIFGPSKGRAPPALPSA